MITFLSLLYYKSLSEHVRRYKVEKQLMIDEEDEKYFLKLTQFRGKLSLACPEDPYIQDKIFKPKILSKKNC